MLNSLKDDIRYALPQVGSGSSFMKRNTAESDKAMIKDLAESALTPDLLRAHTTEVFPLGAKGSTLGYYIPYFDLDGALLRDQDGLTMWRFRYWGGKSKYTQPSKEELAQAGLPTALPYIHPKFHELAKEQKQLVLCEGEKKAACVMHLLDLPAIGIGGCWNWQCNKTKRLHPWIEEMVRRYDIEHVLIIPDGDIARWDILKAYGPLGVDLRDRVKVDFDYLMLPGEEDKIDDLLVAAGPEAEAVFDSLGKCKESQLVEDPGRLCEVYGLSYDENKDGKRSVHLNEANVAILMAEHPWFPELWYNQDNDKPMYGDEIMGASDSMEILVYMQRHFQMPRLKRNVVEDALSTLSQRRPRSPFMEAWQEPWDGVCRIDWPRRLWGVDSDMMCDHMMRWIVGMYARMVEPGCEMGWMLCLSGPQEVGKSGFGEVISDDNHVPMVGDHHGKDTKMLIHHGRVVVLDEMNALYASDATYWKSMITNKKDPWRPPYGRLIVDKYRGSVLMGTTNDQYFLYNDSTGQRRFGVVQVPRLLDFEGLKEELPQIRAQARELYERGEYEYWRTSEEMRAYVAEEHQAEDVPKSALLQYVASVVNAPGYKERVFTTVELAEAMEMPFRGKAAKDTTSIIVNVGFKKVNYSGNVRWRPTKELLERVVGDVSRF